MAAGKLEIHLEDDRREWYAGETLGGTLELVAEKDIECKSFTVRAGWAALSPGAMAVAFLDEYSGAGLKAGEHHSVPFAIELPDGPISYEGTVTSVCWSVQASADVPGSLDPRDQVDIKLLPSEGGELNWHALAQPGTRVARQIEELTGEKGDIPSFADAMPKTNKVLGLGCIALMVLPFLAGAFALIVVGASALHGKLSPRGDKLFAYLVLTIGFAAGIALWRLWLRNRAAEARLGRVALEVDPLLARRGETLAVRLRCRPRRRCRVRAITGEIRGTETHLDTSESTLSQRSVHRHVACSTRFELPTGQLWQAGSPVEVDGEVAIPADAPPTFGAHSDFLDWFVTVRVHLAQGADWEQTQRIVVHP